MPVPRRRAVHDIARYVVVERDGPTSEAGPGDTGVERPSAIMDYIFPRSNAKQEDFEGLDDKFNTEDEDDYRATHATTSITTTRTFTPPSGTSAFLITMTLGKAQVTANALADAQPAQTTVITSPMAYSGQHHDLDGQVSQTTEHLLIAAGSIGATLVLVMIVLAIYTMRKRGITFRDVTQRGINRVRRRSPPPSKYGMDNKQSYEENYTHARDIAAFPLPATINRRPSSHSSPTLLKPLGRSDSLGLLGLERTDSAKRGFVEESIARSNSHHRENSKASSITLPIQDPRQSASMHNTRSLDEDEDDARHLNAPNQPPIPPAAPTFRQFLSNRPSISQRPMFGAPVASRFSWTNSNAPQTPHDTSRDTMSQPIGRDSFMTQRSSMPRFRTVDSWVNQQSNRIEEQRLKEQFRMTQSTLYSADGDDIDEIPEVPPMPKNLKETSGLVGKEIRNKRHKTSTSVLTAPIFKAHPGTEVRFSTRSTVPSEVLDLGPRNAAL